MATVTNTSKIVVTLTLTNPNNPADVVERDISLDGASPTAADYQSGGDYRQALEDLRTFLITNGETNKMKYFVQAANFKDDDDPEGLIRELTAIKFTHVTTNKVEDL